MAVPETHWKSSNNNIYVGRELFNRGGGQTWDEIPQNVRNASSIDCSSKKNTATTHQEPKLLYFLLQCI